MRNTLTKAVLVLIAITGVLFAATPPTLMISDADGNVITVDSTGAVTFSGNCVSGVTCTTSSSTVSGGKIFWTGSIGAFSFSGNIGQTKPILAPPELDLSLNELATDSRGGTITIQWTDTNFNNTGPVSATMNAGGTIGGSGSVTYSAYFDNSNAPFGMGIPVGTLGPFATISYHGSLNGTGATASPYSMTQVVTITLGPASRAGGDFQLNGTPASCNGTIGDFVWIDTNGNGLQDAGEVGLNGITVQLYNGAVVPSNLVSTTTTDNAPSGYNPAPGQGPLAGAPGYYQFTGLCQGAYNVVVDSSQQALAGKYLPTASQVGYPANAAIDSNGSPALVTLATSTSMDETVDFGFVPIAPPTANCVAVNAIQNVPITPVAMTASGGAGGPYTFVATGLPGGLTMSADGSISGTPTVSGTFSYSVTITDKAGNHGCPAKGRIESIGCRDRLNRYRR